MEIKENDIVNQELMKPLSLDMIALFKIIEEDILKTIEGYDGNEPEKLVDEVEKKI